MVQHHSPHPATRLAQYRNTDTSKFGRFWADDAAVAALEFALVAPILLLMILGMMCFGLYFTYIHEVEELAGCCGCQERTTAAVLLCVLG